MAFLKAWLLGAGAMSVLPSFGRSTAEHALGPVGLADMLSYVSFKLRPDQYVIDTNLW